MGRARQSGLSLEPIGLPHVYFLPTGDWFIGNGLYHRTSLHAGMGAKSDDLSCDISSFSLCPAPDPASEDIVPTRPRARSNACLWRGSLSRTPYVFAHLHDPNQHLV